MIQVDEKKRIRLNSLSYYAQFGLTAVFALVTSPALASYLGSAAFGAWRISQRVVEILAFADGRLGQYLKFSVATNIAEKKDGQQIQNNVRAALAFTTKRILLIVVALALLSAILLISPELLGAEYYSLLGEYYPFLTAFFFAAIVNAFVAIPEAALTAAGKSYVPALSQAGGAAVLAALIIVCCKFDLPVFWLGAAPVAAATVTFMAIHIGARRQLTWYPSLQGRNLGWDELRIQNKKLSDSSVEVSVWYGVEKLLLASDMLLIGWLLGATQVAAYTFSSYIYQTGISISLLGTSARVPFLVKALKSDNLDAAAKRTVEMRRRVLFVTAFVALVNVLINSQFVDLWVGFSQYMGRDVDVLLGLALIQVGMIRCDCQILDAKGRFLRKSLIVLAMIGFSALSAFAVAFWISATVPLILFSVMCSRIPFQFWIRKTANSVE
jgi:O-antigen/teichoic acid export membrane protein